MDHQVGRYPAKGKSSLVVCCLETILLEHVIVKGTPTLLAYTALAKLILCFCPPLRFIPRSPTYISVYSIRYVV
jgi:hypothetical protein